MAATADPVAAAIAVPKTDENLVHTDVMLFNRWSYDDVSVILLHSFYVLWIYALKFS